MEISFIDWVNSFPETQEEASKRMTLTRDQVEKIAVETMMRVLEEDSSDNKLKEGE
jgi:hypothetical protein